MFSLSTPWISSLCGDGHLRPLVEISFSTPDGPDHPRQLVADGDGRGVVATSGRDGDRPMLKARPGALSPKRPLGRQQDGPGAVRQQTPEVHVPALADAPQMTAEAAGALTGRQPEPAGKMPGTAKRVDMGDGAHERGRGDDADARNREEALGHGIAGRDACQLAIHVLEGAFRARTSS